MARQSSKESKLGELTGSKNLSRSEPDSAGQSQADRGDGSARPNFIARAGGSAPVERAVTEKLTAMAHDT
jgi:hypothetical protein